MSPRILIITTLVIFQTAVGQSNDATAFLDKVSTAMEAFAKDRPKTLLVSSQIKEMDGDWQPKSITVVEKKIIRDDSTQHVEIIKAIKREKGKEVDVTAEHRKRQQRSKGATSFTRDELFPFSRTERDRYVFALGPDSTVGGRPVRVLRVTAKEQSEKTLNGSYYIDPETLLVLAVAVRPSKLPKLVKDLSMRMSFNLGENGHYLLREFWMRMYASLLVKKIRLEVLEEYKEQTFGAT